MQSRASLNEQPNQAMSSTSSTGGALTSRFRVTARHNKAAAHRVAKPDEVQHQQHRANLDQVLGAARKALAAVRLALRLGPAQRARQAAHACVGVEKTRWV